MSRRFSKIKQFPEVFFCWTKWKNSAMTSCFVVKKGHFSQCVKNRSKSLILQHCKSSRFFFVFDENAFSAIFSFFDFPSFEQFSWFCAFSPIFAYFTKMFRYVYFGCQNNFFYHFWRENSNVYKNCNIFDLQVKVARFARNVVKWDLFEVFSYTVTLFQRH